LLTIKQKVTYSAIYENNGSEKILLFVNVLSRILLGETQQVIPESLYI